MKHYKLRQYPIGIRKLLALAGLFVIAGCGTNVRVPVTTLPEPLLEPVPVKAAVRFDANIETYQYEETLPSGGRYVLSIGEAAATVLKDTYEDLFTETVFVASGERVPSNVDIVVDTSVDALEFALPSQTVTKDFAVWIKFGIKVYDNTGALQSEFPLSAYGKATKDSVLSGQKAALTSASSRALRDAAVLLLTKFAEKAELAGNQLPAVLPPGIAEDLAPLAETETPAPAQSLPTRPDSGEKLL